MLMPAEVIPFLQHADQGVRELALRYLSGAHDPSPATADDIWAAIDRFGGGEYSRCYVALAQMPQTESSLDRTLKALQAQPHEDLAYHLEDVLAKLSYGLLLRSRDLIEQCPALSPELRRHLEERIALATVPAEQLWDRLIENAMAESEENDDEPDDPEQDYRLPSRLVEALARHPQAAQWAIGILNDETIVDWREVYAVDLLGQMRYRPATDLLVETMMYDETADVLIESSVEALVRIGSPDVVRIIRDRFASMDWGIRLSAADVLGRIKLKQSEAALVAILNHEPDLSIKTNIAKGLCELAASDPVALGRLRDLVNNGRWDKMMLALDADVVALFTMVGHEVPELPQWRARVADKEGRRAERMKEMNKFFSDTSKRIQPSEEPEWDEDVPPWAADEAATPSSSPIAVPKTIRRETPKVGRNDPCPCGSGKKYKKCCGK